MAATSKTDTAHLWHFPYGANCFNRLTIARTYCTMPAVEKNTGREISMTMLQTIEDSIIEIRGVPAILDSDVAALYEVETKHVNQAVSNNPDKFPLGYVLQLTDEEWGGLKSKFLTSIKGGKIKRPKAFTEQGLYMLATILKSPKATQTTLAIIETFTKMRRLGRSVRELGRVYTNFSSRC